MKPLPLVFALLILGGSSSADGQQSILLFDGETFDGWSTPDGRPVPDGWEVIDGAMHLASDRGRGGNIVTREVYGDFSLRFEWKIAEGGNNGIKYRVRRFGDRLLGCEYQILDDQNNRHGKMPEKSTGSLYDMYAPSADKFLRPAGEFNRSRIVVRGCRLEHWLNGQVIVSAYVGSCEWWENKARSKFADTWGFGENRYGKIMLTDHNSDVWYRDLVLTPLEDHATEQLVFSRGWRRARPGLLRWRRRR